MHMGESSPGALLLHCRSDSICLRAQTHRFAELSGSLFEIIPCVELDAKVLELARARVL